MNDHRPLSDLELDALLGHAMDEVEAAAPQPSGSFRPRHSASPALIAAPLLVAASMGLGAALFYRPFADDHSQEVEGEGAEIVVAEDGQAGGPGDDSEPASNEPGHPAERPALSSGVTDTEPRSWDPLDLPPVGATVVDPAFGTDLRRLTEADGGQAYLPLTTGSAWNADESRLLLYRTGGGRAGHVVLDLASGELTEVELDADGPGPADIEQVAWDPADPDRLIFPAGSELVALEMSTGSRTTLHEASGCELSTGRAPVRPSADGTVWGLLCSSGDAVEALAVDTRAGTERRRSVSIHSDTAPQPSLSGDRFVLDDGGRILLLDAQLDDIGELSGLDDANLMLGRTVDGTEVAVGPTFDADLPGSAVMASVKDPAKAIEVLAGPATGHPYPPTGTWVDGTTGPGATRFVIGTTGSASAGDATVLDAELAIIDLAESGSPVRRIAHHRNEGDGFTSLPYPSISPSGRQVVFASDWGGRDRTDVFIVELD